MVEDRNGIGITFGHHRQQGADGGVGGGARTGNTHDIGSGHRSFPVPIQHAANRGPKATTETQGIVALTSGSVATGISSDLMMAIQKIGR